MSSDDLLKFPQDPKSASKIASKLNFFTSAHGRKFSYQFMGAAAIGVGAAIYSSQTFFINYYKDFIRAYRNGMKVDVPEEIELIVDKAADLLKLPMRESVNLKTFTTSGFDIHSIGSMNSTYYGWVGVPLNYLYETRQDIDRMNLKLRNKNIDWNSKYGEILEKSLVLTEDEKLFGITRTVLELRNYNQIHSTLIPTSTIFGLYVSAQALNKKLNLFQIPRFGRVLVYGLLSAFAYGVYSVLTDTIKLQQTSRIDKQLVALGSGMIESGISFYEKTLNKNIALRELSGQDLYSVKGNEHSGLLRFNAFPLTTRKLFLEMSLEEARKNEEKQKNAAIDSGNEGKSNAK